MSKSLSFGAFLNGAVRGFETGMDYRETAEIYKERRETRKVNEEVRKAQKEAAEKKAAEAKRPLVAPVTMTAGPPAARVGVRPREEDAPAGLAALRRGAGGDLIQRSRTASRFR